MTVYQALLRCDTAAIWLQCFIVFHCNALLLLECLEFGFNGKWSKNTAELCKRSYAKMSMLSKLRYAGVSRNDLLDLYKLFIRGSAEFYCVDWHNGLNLTQTKAIEKIQSTSLKIILNKDYMSYEDAMIKTGLSTLAQRRTVCCLSLNLV